MKTYKTIEHLKKACIKNNGQKVFVWDDSGFKIGNKRFCMFEYGNMKYNFKGNCYVTFRHMPYKKRQQVYYNNVLPQKEDDEFLTIEYNLLKNEQEHTNNIFQFVLIREYF